MVENAKKYLSEHVENIFKQYTTPGIHICDIATGGGKSYTIGKLTCEYYPQHFDKIIILCVQNKLVTGMDKEIERNPAGQLGEGGFYRRAPSEGQVQLLLHKIPETGGREEVLKEISRNGPSVVPERYYRGRCVLLSGVILR